MTAAHRAIASTLCLACTLAFAAFSAAQPQPSFRDDLMACGKQLERVFYAKNPNKKGQLKVEQDATDLTKLFAKDSEAIKHAIKTKKLPAEPKHQQVLILASSVWVELRTGKTKTPLDKRLTSALVIQAINATVFCNFTSNSGGATVTINPQGIQLNTPTATSWYLPPGLNYTINFQKDGKTDDRPFTPTKDGDTCNGNL